MLSHLFSNVKETFDLFTSLLAGVMAETTTGSEATHALGEEDEGMADGLMMDSTSADSAAATGDPGGTLSAKDEDQEDKDQSPETEGVQGKKRSHI